MDGSRVGNKQAWPVAADRHINLTSLRSRTNKRWGHFFVTDTQLLLYINHQYHHHHSYHHQSASISSSSTSSLRCKTKEWGYLHLKSELTSTCCGNCLLIENWDGQSENIPAQNNLVWSFFPFLMDLHFWKSDKEIWCVNKSSRLILEAGRLSMKKTPILAFSISIFD